VQRHESSFCVEASPAEIWLLWFPPRPADLPPEEMQVLEMDDIRIEIMFSGNDIHDGLVRHCRYAIPKYMMTGGVAESWELITDVVPNTSYRYRAITRPPFAFAEGRQWLEDRGDGNTRVHFSESYAVSNPLLRRLLERRLHDRISRDNDKLIKDRVQKGLAMLRSFSAGEPKDGHRPQ
jgi:hypothetical protein